jgi:ABC-2 type transport system ATP-binding protein
MGGRVNPAGCRESVFVTVHDVVKRFETVTAVGGVSFRVRRGEIFALLGPNGAGKTTLVRMLMGILRPDAGTVQYSLSSDAGRAARWPAPADLGYLPEERGFYKDVPVLRALTYFGRLRGMSRTDAENASRRWLERLDLAERAREKLDSLSKGNQQKVQFIAAVVHRPAFAVLDEPFSGLDPLNQEFFLELLRELRSQGTAILLSAHQMQLVERVADRVLLMNRGQEVLSGTLDEIRRRVDANRRVVLRVRGDADPAALGDDRGARRVVRVAQDELAVLIGEGEALGEVLAMAGRRLDVVDVRTESVSLHDIFLHALGRRGGPPDPEEPPDRVETPPDGVAR